MSAPVDIDALHATWKAATAVRPMLSDWGRWINAITPAWPAIYDRLRELEAERDSESMERADAEARADREAGLRQTAEADADRGWSWAVRPTGDSDPELDTLTMFEGDLDAHRAAVAERAGQ